MKKSGSFDDNFVTGFRVGAAVDLHRFRHFVVGVEIVSFPRPIGAALMDVSHTFVDGFVAEIAGASPDSRILEDIRDHVDVVVVFGRRTEDPFPS